MFNIGFWEICLIVVVALVVLGPERMPSVARTLGEWFGLLRNTVQSFKDEIDKSNSSK